MLCTGARMALNLTSMEPIMAVLAVLMVYKPKLCDQQFAREQPIRLPKNPS